MGLPKPPICEGCSHRDDIEKAERWYLCGVFDECYERFKEYKLVVTESKPCLIDKSFDSSSVLSRIRKEDMLKLIVALEKYVKECD